MLHPTVLAGLFDSLAVTTEPGYVLAFTTLNATVGMYVVAKQLRKQKRTALEEKPGRRPE